MKIFYTALILNIVLTAIPVFLSIWLNSKKHGFFYAIVFTLLTALIICHFPIAYAATMAISASVMR